MSLVSQHASSSTRSGPEESPFQSVTINLPGRLMCADYSEHDCVVSEMSPGGALFVCGATPRAGERIVAYLDHLGRIEGIVCALERRGFAIDLNATTRKREKLAAQLTWLANKHELGLPEDRRHERYAPRNARTDLQMEDGRRYACRIIDLSLSGAAVELEVRPAMGTAVTLGTMRGRVVRHFEDGVAIEFVRIQPAEALRAFL